MTGDTTECPPTLSAAYSAHTVRNRLSTGLKNRAPT